ALEQLGVLDHGHADFLVAVCRHELAQRGLEVLPQADVGRQHIVHAAHGLDGFRHGNAVTVPPEVITKFARRPRRASAGIGTTRPSISTVAELAYPSSTRS